MAKTSPPYSTTAARMRQKRSEGPGYQVPQVLPNSLTSSELSNRGALQGGSNISHERRGTTVSNASKEACSVPPPPVSGTVTPLQIRVRVRGFSGFPSPPSTRIAGRHAARAAGTAGAVDAVDPLFEAIAALAFGSFSASSVHPSASSSALSEGATPSPRPPSSRRLVTALSSSPSVVAYIPVGSPSPVPSSSPMGSPKGAASFDEHF